LALTEFQDGLSCQVRQGDVVVHWYDPDPSKPRQFPLHMAIHVGSAQVATGRVPRLRIRGLPEVRLEESIYLGDCWTGEKGGAWYANMLGRRLDVDEVRVQAVVLISELAITEYSQLETKCEWNESMVVDESRPLRGKYPLFLKGTCAHYVEWLYECAGLDLVAQDRLYDPDHRERLYPATQIHAFWRGEYPLDCLWDDRLRKYPDCKFGPPSEESAPEPEAAGAPPKESEPNAQPAAPIIPSADSE
jgi:hypothetical protein